MRGLGKLPRYEFVTSSQTEIDGYRFLRAYDACLKENSCIASKSILGCDIWGVQAALNAASSAALRKSAAPLLQEYTADACNVQKSILLTKSACLELDETMSPWPRKELGIQMRKLGSVDC